MMKQFVSSQILLMPIRAVAQRVVIEAILKEQLKIVRKQFV